MSHWREATVRPMASRVLLGGVQLIQKGFLLRRQGRCHVCRGWFGRSTATSVGHLPSRPHRVTARTSCSATAMPVGRCRRLHRATGKGWRAMPSGLRLPARHSPGEVTPTAELTVVARASIVLCATATPGWVCGSAGFHVGIPLSATPLAPGQVTPLTKPWYMVRLGRIVDGALVLVE